MAPSSLRPARAKVAVFGGSAAPGQPGTAPEAKSDQTNSSARSKQVVDERGSEEECVMITRSLYVAVTSSLLLATALTPARAADMTFERALAAGEEPQHWLLHHGNYQGHRFSQPRDINTDTVNNLKLAFTVELGRIDAA